MLTTLRAARKRSIFQDAGSGGVGGAEGFYVAELLSIIEGVGDSKVEVGMAVLVKRLERAVVVFRCKPLCVAHPIPSREIPCYESDIPAFVCPAARKRITCLILIDIPYHKTIAVLCRATEIPGYIEILEPICGAQSIP